MVDLVAINKVIEKIVATVDPKMIIIFGSVAKGTTNDDSDIDIMVVAESELPFLIRTAKVRSAIGAIGVPIDLVVYTPEELKKGIENEFSFISEVVSTGKVVYESV